jgi:transcription termination factor Rho
VLSTMNVVDSMEFLLDKLSESKSNQDFFNSMNQ